MKKRILSIVLCMATALTLASCAAGDNYAPENDMYKADDELPLVNISSLDKIESEDHGKLVENPFVDTEKENVSTFSADVDTASYAYLRKLIEGGYDLKSLKSTAGNNLRTEELINYFDYTYEKPSDGELFGVRFSAALCPWNTQNVLMTATLATEDTIVKSKNNIVFLIDVSGSMASNDKMELLKRSFSYLIGNLGDDDIISIVTYAGNSSVVLDSCSGAKKDMIMNAVNSLEVGGSTNGGSGMIKAYEIAEKNFLTDGNNRIIMASDGDLNVGLSSTNEIQKLVEDKRKTGVYLSVLGFGTGNYKDSMMETIADNGNGVYYYIDGEYEAEKIFGQDLLATLYPVASDVKLQFTFDKAAVKSYRLIGYENRLLNKEDFDNDTKDAGELGAGHAVTVCYELVMNKTDIATDEWAKLAVRHKPIGEEKSVLNEYTVKGIYSDTTDDDLKFISAVIKTAMILHDSEYMGQNKFTVSDVINDLSSLELTGDKAQFRELLKKLEANGSN